MLASVRTLARFPAQLSLVAAVWALLVWGFAHPAITLAHAEAERTSPDAGASVNAAPAKVDIWFSEEVIPARSSIQVFDAANRQVSTGVNAVDNSHLQATLAPNLPNGEYRVAWTSVSADDGHVAKGTFSFTVGAAGATATVAAPAAQGAHAAMDADAGSSSLLDSARLIIGALALCCAGLLAVLLVRRASR